MATPRHLLLVDGDAEVRLMVDRRLSELGWDAVVASSGEDALALAGADFRIDVLLTEVELPDMDGRDLAWAVCRRRPFTRVAFMGRHVPGDLDRALDGPLLVKPFTASALADALARAQPLRRS